MALKLLFNAFDHFLAAQHSHGKSYDRNKLKELSLKIYPKKTWSRKENSKEKKSNGFWLNI